MFLNNCLTKDSADGKIGKKKKYRNQSIKEVKEIRMEKLTDKEQKVFDYLVAAIRRDGYAPSVRDIQRALAIPSTSTVHSILAQLDTKGYIQKENGKSRTIRIEAETQTGKTIRIPLIGMIRAGMPVLAEENAEEDIDFPVKQVKGAA